MQIQFLTPKQLEKRARGRLASIVGGGGACVVKDVNINATGNAATVPRQREGKQEEGRLV